ncbi:S1 family peptidase [Plantactinospora sp. CA-290183]|uniref:S1 family peptidase n=1 Tax=Plantactinospora sp. CA-290183 TaxID=3240006 RepID=UPI003D913178
MTAAIGVGLLLAAGLGVVQPVSAAPQSDDQATYWMGGTGLPGGPPVPPSPTPMVVGGYDATELYPGMASLQFIAHPTNGQPSWHTCGGFLTGVPGVAAGWVVVAAHCVTVMDSRILRDPANWQVRIGTNLRSAGGTLARVTQVVLHPEWDWFASGDVGDIAMLRLDRPVPHAPYLPLPVVDRDGKVRLLGWGTRDMIDLPEVLQEGDTTLAAAELCAAAAITDDELCVDNRNGVAATPGDSGGPALQRIGSRWVAVGIASRLTVGLPLGAGRAVYTSVAHYAAWMWWVMATGRAEMPTRATYALAG